MSPMELRYLVVAWSVLMVCASTPSLSFSLPQREHPFLFGDAALFARAKDRAAKTPWAKEQLDAIVKAADSAIATAFSLPEEGGQWSHHYACKACGAGLSFEEGKHLCKKCGAEYSGWPYDQVIIARIHSKNWQDVRALGLAYALTGRERYAEKSREILLGYAGKYLDYPLHDVRNNSSRTAARVFAQTLDESVAIIGVAWGYDLIYVSPCLSPEDKERIETGFLRAVVETIKKNDAGISNWQSWHNAGIAAVGFCIQDPEIVATAIDGKSGLRFQLANSILKDGFWHEGTVAYHFYALDALRWTVEAAYHAGMDIWNDPAYKSLFDAPLLYTLPDLTFPAVNDSDSFSLEGRHASYDLAYARLGDERYCAVAQRGNRQSLEAFLWGVDELPPAPQTPLESHDFPGLGAVILRRGSGEDALAVHLDYGPHGGGHGHPDKLAIIFYGLDRTLAPDPGRLAYSAPLQGSWYKQSVSHNTVCVDRKSQKATEGRLTWFGVRPQFCSAQAECDSTYDGVLMRRTLVLTDRYLVDVFEVRSDENHEVDWVFHNIGEIAPGLEASSQEEPLGEGAGYEHVTEIRAANGAEDWNADFNSPDGHVRLMMLGQEGTRVLFGKGLTNNPPEPCPVVVVRRSGKIAVFATLIEPYREAPSVTAFKELPIEEGSWIAFEIQRGPYADFLMVAANDGSERAFRGVRTRDPVRLSD